MLPFRALKRLERGALKKPNKALLEDLMLLMPLSIPLTLLCPKIDRLKVALNLNLMLKWSIMLLPHPETRNMLLCKSLLRKHLGIGLLLMFLRQVLMLHRVLAQVHRPLTLRLPLSQLKLNAKKRLLIVRSGSKRRILVVNPLLSLEMRLPLVLLSLSPTKKCLERLFLLACCPLTFLCRVFLLLRIPRRLKQGPDSALRHLLLPPGLATRLLLRTREKAAAIQREVGDYVPHDASLLCTKHGLNEQHIPNELRFLDEDKRKILPCISIFLSKSFFESPRQEKPRRGFGSSLVINGLHNSDTEWPTGYYCLFCRMKNKINANTWGKPFSTLAALLSHGAGSNCIPIAYLCLLRKQYHWRRAMLATHIITNSAFVGDKAVKDETRHPHAELPRIWNIFTTKGECDADCQVPPPPGPEDPRRHGDSARGAASSNAQTCSIWSPPKPQQAY